MAAARLRNGYHLFPMTDGTWVLFGPRDNWTRLNADQARIEQLAQALRDAAGGAPVDFAALGVADMVAELDAAGMLAADGSPSNPALAPTTASVWLHGAAPLTDAVTGMLSALGVRTRNWPDPRALPDCAMPHDVMLDIAPWQPLHRWQTLDRACRARQIAWYGCHHEGERVYAGPLLHAQAPLTYEGVLARRFASADHPQELQAYFDYLEQGAGIPAPPSLTATATALLAGTISADILACLQGQIPDAMGWQYSIDIAGRHPQRHPILPVPRHLAT
jgi:hypothetical protein